MYQILHSHPEVWCSKIPASYLLPIPRYVSAIAACMPSFVPKPLHCQFMIPYSIFAYWKCTCRRPGNEAMHTPRMPSTTGGSVHVANRTLFPDRKGGRTKNMTRSKNIMNPMTTSKDERREHPTGKTLRPPLLDSMCILGQGRVTPMQEHRFCQLFPILAVTAHQSPYTPVTRVLFPPPNSAGHNV